MQPPPGPQDSEAERPCEGIPADATAVLSSDPVVDKAEVETSAEVISIDDHQPKATEAIEVSPTEPDLSVSDGVELVQEEVATAASADMPRLAAPSDVNVSSRHDSQTRS